MWTRNPPSWATQPRTYCSRTIRRQAPLARDQSWGVRRAVRIQAGTKLKASGAALPSVGWLVVSGGGWGEHSWPPTHPRGRAERGWLPQGSRVPSGKGSAHWACGFLCVSESVCLCLLCSGTTPAERPRCFQGGGCPAHRSAPSQEPLPWAPLQSGLGALETLGGPEPGYRTDWGTGEWGGPGSSAPIS